MEGKKKYIYYILVCIVSTVLILLANNDSVWCDEAYTMLNCRGSFSYMLNNLKVDSWPPFYLFFSWVYAKLFGCSVFTLKIFSILPIIFLMLYGVKVIHKNFESTETAILFCLFVSLMPVSIHTALEIRGYSWAMLFVTICGVEAWLLFKNPKSKAHLIIFFVTGILAAYTHYFALVSVCYIYFFLLLGILVVKSKKDILGKCLLCVLGSIVSYMPWITKFIGATKSVAKGYWISAVSMSDLLDYYQFPFTSQIDNLGSVKKNTFSEIAIIVLAWLVVDTIVDITKEKNEEKRYELFFQICCVMIIILTVISGYILSRIIQPMFVPRYMKPAMGLLWLFISFRISKLSKNTKTFMVAFFLVLFSYGFVAQKDAEKNTGTEAAKQIIQMNFNNGYNTICSDSDYLNWTEIEYYFPEAKSYKNCSDIDVITEKGSREKIIFLATKDFSTYRKKFEEKKYTVENIGKYNFDNCYYFDLFIIQKNK